MVVFVNTVVKKRHQMTVLWEPFILQKTSLAPDLTILTSAEGVSNERRTDLFIQARGPGALGEMCHFALIQSWSRSRATYGSSQTQESLQQQFLDAMAEANSCDITCRATWISANLIPFCVWWSRLLILSFVYRWQWPFIFSLTQSSEYTHMPLLTLLKELARTVRLRCSELWTQGTDHMSPIHWLLFPTAGPMCSYNAKLNTQNNHY